MTREPPEDGAAARPDKLAFNVEGGIQLDAKMDTVDVETALVVLPERLTVPLPEPSLPEAVLAAIAAVQARL